jgi:hypothetical protein
MLRESVAAWIVPSCTTAPQAYSVGAATDACATMKTGVGQVRTSKATPRRGLWLSRDMALAAAALALTGCATQTRYQTVYCIQPGDLPTADQCAGRVPASADLLKLCEPPKVHDKLTGNADTDVGILAGSVIRMRAWGGGLRTILEGCREPNPNKP